MDTSRANLIFTILLAILLALGIYNTYRLEEINSELLERINALIGSTSSGPCDNSARYANTKYPSAEEVSADDAGKWVNAYREKHAGDNSIYKITGFHISKKAIDSIFSRNLRQNCLSMDLIEQGDTALGLIIRGKTSDSSDVIFNDTYKSSIYRLYSTCPSDCCSY